MPRKEAAERKARERAAAQPALDCEACGALTPATRFRYFCDRLICQTCEYQNAQSRVRPVPRELLEPRTICIKVIPLGPQIRVQSAETLRRLLSYLGATPAQLAEFDNCHRRWGQGIQITIEPERKNLLRLRR